MRFRGRSRTRSGIRGISRAVPTILTTLGARRGPGPANWHDRGRPRCTSAGPSKAGRGAARRGGGRGERPSPPGGRRSRRRVRPARAHEHVAHARPPNPAYTGNGSKVKLSYIISAFSLSLHTVVTNHRPLPSGVIGGRRGITIVMGLGVSSIKPPMRVVGRYPRRG